MVTNPATETRTPRHNICSGSVIERLLGHPKGCRSGEEFFCALPQKTRYSMEYKKEYWLTKLLRLLLVALVISTSVSYTSNLLKTENEEPRASPRSSLAKHKPHVVRNTIITKRIYTLGDSLTLGFGASEYGVIQRKLNSLLGPEWDVINGGLGGNKTSEMLSRLQQNVLARNDINYVIVWGGVNDVYQDVPVVEIQRNLQEIYTRLHASNIKVVALNLPPSKGSATWTEARQKALELVNNWIANSAIDVDYTIDIYSLLEDPAQADTLSPVYNGGDSLHINSTADYLIGEKIFQTAFKNLNG